MSSSLNPLSTYFSKIPDPRKPCNAQVHILLEMITLALCAMLAGCESFADMERFGQDKQRWLQEELGLRLPGGVPSHDTLGRLFAQLDPQAFGAAMQTWTQALHHATQGDIVAIDGKKLRRSFDKASDQSAIFLVNAWVSGSRLVLGQCKTDQKSNEITAVPSLLSMLDVRGCIVTTDALNTQKNIAAQIREQKADYLLALKGNHALLHEEVKDYFGWCEQQAGGLAKRCDSWTETREFGHGRYEVRRCYVVSATPQDWPRACEQWAGLQSFVMVESLRRSGEAEASHTSVERRFYLASLPADAPRCLGAARAHWGVENNVHWCLDVAFDEDDCRVRVENAAENLGVMRRLCLNLFSQEKSDKRGLKAKRLRAAWNEDYLLRVLVGNKS